ALNLAFLDQRPLPFDAALLVVDVAEGIAEEFLLFGAVLAPVETVHHRVLLREALSEAVVDTRFAGMTAAIPDADRRRHNGQRDHELDDLPAIGRFFGFRPHADSKAEIVV